MEGLEIYTVELYLKVRLACAEGMSKRAAARHFNISRDTVDKAMAFSIPPGHRGRVSKVVEILLRRSPSIGIWT